MHLNTILAQAGCRRDAATGAISTPIYQTATFAHPALGRSTGFDYSRSSNPTRLALEDTLAALEGGVKAFAFASGLAAIDTMLRLFRPGDRIIATADMYGGTHRLFEQMHRPFGLEFIYLDTSDTAAVQAALQGGHVRAVFIESPANPVLRVADIRRISESARARGALMIVDNTFMTAVLQRPFELGADLVVYSATKYLGGHNDVVAGALVARTRELAERLAFLQNGIGAVLGPQDAWLLLRGLKTLALRLERQQENARRIAAWLTGHPRVSRIHYPGLANHPGKAVLERQATGPGAMVSFEVTDPGRIPAILSGVKVFQFAESLGGVESLITLPAVQTHADMPADMRQQLGITDGLLRLSVGIEEAGDLIADLEAVL